MGEESSPKSAKIYTLTWGGMFLLGLLVVLLGVPPLRLVKVSIIFGMAIMPFTYYPILPRCFGQEDYG